MATVKREAPNNTVDPKAPWQPCSVHGQNWNRACVECGNQAVAHLADTLRGELAIADRVNAWKDQCILDLAAGKHAVGCGCQQRWMAWPAVDQPGMKDNACTHIVKCARDLVGYEVEAGDES